MTAQPPIRSLQLSSQCLHFDSLTLRLTHSHKVTDLESHSCTSTLHWRLTLSVHLTDTCLLRSNYRIFLLYCCFWSINGSRLLTIIISITNYYYYIITKLFLTISQFYYLNQLYDCQFLKFCATVHACSWSFMFFSFVPSVGKNFWIKLF